MVGAPSLKQMTSNDQIQNQSQISVDYRYVMILNDPKTSKHPWINHHWAHSTRPPEVRESLAGCLLLIRPCAAPASYIRLGKLHLGPAAEFPHSARSAQDATDVDHIGPFKNRAK